MSVSIQWMYNMKCFVIIAITGATETVTRLKAYPETIPGKRWLDSPQKQLLL